MNAIIETTTKKALKRARKELRNMAGVKRLSSFMYEHSRCQCACGESYAIMASTMRNNSIFHVNVGQCKICGKTTN